MSLLPVVVTMMSARRDHVLQPRHLVALQQRLERADRVDLGHDHPRALARERGRGALADVAEAADQRDLAADEHVGGPVEAVDERVADAVGVVELALGDRVVDVDRREQQLALLGELVEPVHAGGGLLGDAEDALGDPLPLLRVGRERAAQHVEDDPVLVGDGEVVGLGRVGTTPAFSNSTPLWTSSVASPPSSRIMLGPTGPASPKSNSLSVAHQYSARVSPFHANTETPCGASGVPCGPTTAAAAAWSCVEKMLHDTQRTSAPSDTSVSMRTAVWTVMCREPAMRAPCRGRASAYSRRSSIRPGISCSASRISLRPNSWRSMSATAKSSPPALVEDGVRPCRGRRDQDWRSWVNPPERADRARGSMGPTTRDGARAADGPVRHGGLHGCREAPFVRAPRAERGGPPSITVRCSASRAGQVVPLQDREAAATCQTVRPAHRCRRRSDLNAFLNARVRRRVLCSRPDGSRREGWRAMHSEQDAARRAGRWRAAVVLSVLVLASCGTGAARQRPDGAAPAQVNGTVRAGAQEPADAAAAVGGARSAASLPDELVGSWSADDPQGVGSWTIAFAADGRYAQSNPLRGVTVGGQAAVAGRKLYLQPEDADSQTFVWQVTGDGLRLDDHVYRRTARAAGAA